MYISHLLPFSRALSLESVLNNILSDKGLNEIYRYIFKENKRIFENRYSRYLRSLTLLDKRSNFFMGVLTKNEDILEKYEDEIGNNNLNERVVSALISCYNEGNRLVEELDKIIGDFYSECLKDQREKLSSEKNIRKIRRDMKRGKIDGEVGRGSIDLENALVNLELKAVSNWTLGSDCEKTGVCVCRGADPPYMKSCINEKAILHHYHSEDV